MATDHNTGAALPILGDTVTHACWSCGDMRAAHFCEACGRLQPAQPADYFTFFGLPRRLTLDVPALEREFHRLSRKLHPDVYAGASPREQQWSLEKSSQLNDAYRTLRDPIARTRYLLALEGVKLEEQSKAATDQARHSGREKQQVVPPDLLEEVFELNLQLEEFRANQKLGEDDPTLRAQIEHTRADLKDKLAASDADLQKLWREWDARQDRAVQPFPAVPGAEHSSDAERTRLLQGMLDLLNRRKYLSNLVRDVTAALEGVAV